MRTRGVALSSAAQLRTLMAGGPFIAADCYSALTARIVEQVGFPAAYMGGHATGMMHYAIPDSGALTPTEMIEQAARVAEAISIPLVVDADQAGESVTDVHRSVRRYERAHVAGIHIEDEIPPKHSSWHGRLLPVEDMQSRIRVAADARQDDLVLIARCDELYSNGGGGGGSLDEAIRRGVAYAEAGADAFLAPFATDEQVATLAAELPVPVVIYGPLVPGAALSLYTGWGVASAARQHRHWAMHLMEHGEVPMEAVEFPGKAEAIDQLAYDEVIAGWARATGRPLREG